MKIKKERDEVAGLFTGERGGAHTVVYALTV